jgi:hypothetical protein
MAERRSKLGRPLASEAPGPKVRTVKFEARIKELIENLPDLAELVEPLLIVRRVRYVGLRVDSKRTRSKRPRGGCSQTLINSITAPANASGSSCGRL